MRYLIMLKIKSSLITFVFLLSIVSFFCVGCGKSSNNPLKIATTTSTDNTGLMDYLKPHFEKDTGITMHWVAVGTGKALQLGKNCDVDILMVHAPGAEKKYVKEGYGVKRHQIMYNDFVIIGPAKDPAGIKGKKMKEVLAAISAKKAVFASRGDNSGTHKKELSLWTKAGLKIPEKESWYVQTGQGMLNTINIASERGGYTLTDRGTYIKYESSKKGNPSLVILAEGEKMLLNQYSLIAINSKKCGNVNTSASGKLIDWMKSKKAQDLIGKFRLLNKPLFTPNAN
jgi:tungstate transport system substrate-binding protein